MANIFMKKRNPRSKKKTRARRLDIKNKGTNLVQRKSAMPCKRDHPEDASLERAISLRSNPHSFSGVVSFTLNYFFILTLKIIFT